jgi:hypothetical protein
MNISPRGMGGFLTLAVNPMLGFAIFHPITLFYSGFCACRCACVGTLGEKPMLVSALLLTIVFLFSFGLYYYQGLFTEMSLYSDLLKILPPV